MGDGTQPSGPAAAETVVAAVESPENRGGDLHDGRPFEGMRFLLIPPPPGQEQERLGKRIAALGGQVLGPVHYKSCTHVCLKSGFLEKLQDALRREGKEPVGHDWVNEHFDRSNLVLDDDDDEAASLQANGEDGDGMCDVVSSTSKKGSMCVFGSESSSSLGRSVSIKQHCCEYGDEEMIWRGHHYLFLCKLDRSPKISLHDYAIRNQSTLQVVVAVPGSRHGRTTTSTGPEAKMIVWKAYRILKRLHEVGLTLAGNFSAKNFLISEVLYSSNNIVLGHLPSGALKKCNGPADEELDLTRFDKMIRRELFVASIVPHDLNVWLSLLNEKGLEELLPDHMSRMDTYMSVDTFMSLCDHFQEMEHKDPDKQNAIINELSGYSDWKRRVNSREANSYLQEALHYINPATNRMDYYEDNLRGLLRFLRNFCDRTESWNTVALVVGQDFPNLMSDLQEKMFKAGYYVPRPRWD